MCWKEDEMRTVTTFHLKLPLNTNGVDICTHTHTKNSNQQQEVDEKKWRWASRRRLSRTDKELVHRVDLFFFFFPLFCSYNFPIDAFHHLCCCMLCVCVQVCDCSQRITPQNLFRTFFEIELRSLNASPCTLYNILFNAIRSGCVWSVFLSRRITYMRSTAYTNRICVHIRWLFPFRLNSVYNRQIVITLQR